MNNIRNISRLACVLSLSLMVMASCSDDDNDPQQGEKSSAKSIASVSFLGLDPKVAGFVTEKSKVVSVIVPAGTDVTALVPTIVISDKATIAPASGAKQDFSSPVTYTVTAEDGSEQKYKVSVSKEGIIIKSLSTEQIDRGQTLTIHGDFTIDGNTVQIVGEGDWGILTLDKTSESATKIDVTISEWVNAGKYYIVVENSEGLSFMYPEVLTVGHPAVIASVAKTIIKPGEDVVFTGENLDTEEVYNIEVAFRGDDSHWGTPSVSENGTRLTIAFPEWMPPGTYEVTVMVNYRDIYTTDLTVIQDK